MAIKTPASIEKESFNIIREGLTGHQFSEPELTVITRIIHATADFDFAEDIVFSNNAICSGIEAVRHGCSAVTDVNMVKAGIRSDILKRYGGEVICKISDEDVIHEAKEKKTTRASVTIRRSKTYIQNGIVAVGNSPTALYEIIRLIKYENISPKLVIGLPVGFVDAKEAKMELMALSSVPYISNSSRKGGTPAAVAVINALLGLCEA